MHEILSPHRVGVPRKARHQTLCHVQVPRDFRASCTKPGIRTQELQLDEVWTAKRMRQRTE